MQRLSSDPTATLRTLATSADLAASLGNFYGDTNGDLDLKSC